METQIGVCPILSTFKNAVSDCADVQDQRIFEACAPTLEYTLDCDSVERQRAAYLAGEVYRIACGQYCFAAEAAAEIALTEVNYRKNARHSADALSEAIWYLAMQGAYREWLPDVVGALCAATAIRSQIF